MLPSIMVLGANGLIGAAVAQGLEQQGLRVVPVARRWSGHRRLAWSVAPVTAPLAGLDRQALGTLLDAHDADIVVNTLGVLQGNDAQDVHQGFVERLLDAIADAGRPILLIHISIPGEPEDDVTGFARTKRAAEALIAASAGPSLILRPGLVVAAAAYGGSALIRALAMLPVVLPHALGARPLAATAVDDIWRSIAFAATRWRAGEWTGKAAWDVMETAPGTLADVVEAFRNWGGGPQPRFRMPAIALRLGALCGDAVARLGWAPPIRSTSLAELGRGVAGRPRPWMTQTGIVPLSLDETLRALPSTIQERWFARLYLLKPILLALTSMFWIASGLVAITVGFGAACLLAIARGMPRSLAPGFTIATAILDMAIGSTIALRRTCHWGLVSGIAVALAYVVGASLMAPALWADPLGPLIKVLPSVAVMLVILAVLGNR